VPRALLTALVLATCLVTLSTGAALKTGCSGDRPDWRSDPCYNDIEPLYVLRGIDAGTFPYVHARLSADGFGSNGFNEYPVLTGLFMWATGQAVSTAHDYLLVSIVGLGVCALLTAALLARIAGLRALTFAAAPPLALYAFHNWDLLAVAAATVGLALWWSGRPRWAAVAFGIGGAFKLYPILFVVPLVLEQLLRRRNDEALRVGACGVATLVLTNLPFVVAGPSGWWATYRFHETRLPSSSGTVWANAIGGISTGAENALSAFALVLALAAISFAFLRGATGGRAEVFAWCAAVTAALLVLSKVSSPQYVLWVLPFFAVVRTNLLWWVALCAVTVVRYWALFGVGDLGLGMSTADEVVRLAVYAQAATLTAWAAVITVRMGSLPGP